MLHCTFNSVGVKNVDSYIPLGMKQLVNSSYRRWCPRVCPGQHRPGLSRPFLCFCVCFSRAWKTGRFVCVGAYCSKQVDVYETQDSFRWPCRITQTPHLLFGTHFDSSCFVGTLNFHILGIEGVAYEHSLSCAQKKDIWLAHGKLCVLSFDFALALPWYTFHWLCKTANFVFAMKSKTTKPCARFVFICFCHCRNHSNCGLRALERLR